MFGPYGQAQAVEIAEAAVRELAEVPGAVFTVASPGTELRQPLQAPG